MSYYRITYFCEMRNTPEREAELEKAKLNRYYKPTDDTKNYTESTNYEAETEAKAKEYALIKAHEKTTTSQGRDKDYGFTVKYAVKSVDQIGESLINDDAKTLHYSFAIDRMRVFEVEYYRCGGNKTMQFSTSVARFNQPKTDCNECGQAQERLLPKHSAARKFFDKWDSRHLKELGDAEYNELLRDIKTLKSDYYYLTTDYEKGVPFSHQKNLSMTIPRKYSAMGGNNEGGAPYER